jgi:hypothetical protein
MPWADQEMLDAIQASTPEWNGKITALHYALGEDFDKFMDPKWFIEPMPKSMIEEYNQMHEEAKPAILESLIQAHKERIAGRYKELDFNDSYMTAKELDEECGIYRDQPPMSGKKRMTFEQVTNVDKDTSIIGFITR